MCQRYAAAVKESPQSATPQNFKSSQIQTTKAETIFLDTAKTSNQNDLAFGQSRQVMTLQNSQIHGRKVDSPKVNVNGADVLDSRPKTSAQQTRRIKSKRSGKQVAPPLLLNPPQAQGPEKKLKKVKTDR